MPRNRVRDPVVTARLSFNGATAFQPWIPAWHPGEHVVREHRHASMEPRPFSHGYAVDRRPVVPLPTPGLQWSHGFSAMDTTPAMVMKIGMPLAFLQWSHGFSAMDTCLIRRNQVAIHDIAPPFNGATAFQPWILGRASKDCSAIAEIRPFNGATAFQPWIPW